MTQFYKPFLITAVLLIVFSFFVQKRTLDLHISDTYIVVALKTVCWTFAAAMLVFSAVYYFAGGSMSRFLTWTHIVLTIFVALLLIGASFGQQWMERSLSDDINVALQQRRKFFNAIHILVLLMIAAQLVFLINLVVALVKRYT